MEMPFDARAFAAYQARFRGRFLLTRELRASLNDGGRIVNSSSGFVRIIIPGSRPYDALKTAIEVLTRPGLLDDVGSIIAALCQNLDRWVDAYALSSDGMAV
jgi:NAD(P)-dependent dehydrogenase (short-subunit alcohol dehydrogenase family)